MPVNNIIPTDSNHYNLANIGPDYVRLNIPRKQLIDVMGYLGKMRPVTEIDKFYRSSVIKAFSNWIFGCGSASA